jgi:hypothetical protein
MHRKLFAARSARVQHVQAHPTDDRRQPRLHVVHGPGILVADPQPCLLESIVGFAHRTEHSVGDRAKMRSVLLEPFGQPRALVHRQLPAPTIRSSPVAVVGDVGGQSSRRQKQEERGLADLAVAHS